MPVIQGGGISYDRGAGARESMGQLAQSLAQARAAANAEQATKLQGQRDALTRYTTLMDEMGKVAQAANIPLSAFVRTQAGSNYLNQMFQEYSLATGKQLSSDEALKMSTDVIELINNPDYMDRFTTDWFTAQYRSPSGQAVATEPKAPAAEAPAVQGAAQGAQGAAQGDPASTTTEASDGTLEYKESASEQPVGADVTRLGHSDESTLFADLGSPNAPEGVGIAAQDLITKRTAALRMENLSKEQLQKMISDPNVPPSTRMAAQKLFQERQVTQNLVGSTVYGYVVIDDKDKGSTASVYDPKTGTNRPTVSESVASRVLFLEELAKSDPSIKLAPTSDMSAKIAATGQYFQKHPEAETIFQEYLRTGVIPKTAPAPQTTPQQSQAAPRVLPPDVRDWYKFVTGQEPPGTKDSPERQKALEDFYDKNTQSYNTWKARKSGRSSLTVPGSKLPAAMSEDEIASTFPNTPKFVSSVLVRNIRESESPLDAMAKAMTSQKTGQALLNSNVQPVEKEPVAAPPKVTQAVSDMGQLVVKSTSGAPLTYKEQMLLRQKAAVAGNWVNTTWKGMSDQDRLAAAKQLAEELTTLPAAFLELRYPGKDISTLREKQAQMDSNLKVAAANAIAKSSGDGSIKEIVDMYKVAVDHFNNLKDSDTAQINAQKMTPAEFYTKNPNNAQALKDAQANIDSILKGLGVAVPESPEYIAVKNGLLKRIFSGEPEYIFTIKGPATSEVKDPTKPSAGTELGSQYAVK